MYRENSPMQHGLINILGVSFGSAQDRLSTPSSLLRRSDCGRNDKVVDDSHDINLRCSGE